MWTVWLSGQEMRFKRGGENQMYSNIKCVHIALVEVTRQVCLWFTFCLTKVS